MRPFVHDLKKTYTKYVRLSRANVRWGYYVKYAYLGGRRGGRGKHSAEREAEGSKQEARGERQVQKMRNRESKMVKERKPQKTV